MQTLDRIFVINLPHETVRKTHMENVLKYSQIPVEFVHAYDGRRLQNKAKLKRHVRRPMSDGEIGCFLSHCHVYSKIAHLPENHWGLVLEDDVILNELWYAHVTNALRQMNADCDILFCGFDTPDVFFKMMMKDVEGEFHRKDDIDFSKDCVIAAPRINLHAYAVSKRGALNILKKLTRIETAIDVQIHFSSLGLNVFALKYGVATQDKSFTSSIKTIKRQKKKKHIVILISMILIVCIYVLYLEKNHWMGTD